MQLQQINPNMISITQLRKDIDILEDVLANNDEAMVVRNQDVLFVAITPKRYQEIKDKGLEKQKTLNNVVVDIDRFRNTIGNKVKGNAASDYVVKMRDEQANKWKNWS